MAEFDSVSVAATEASTLSAQLTEKSADGWDVVAIVPTNDSITAFLRKGAALSTTSPTYGTGDSSSDLSSSTSSTSSSSSSGFNPGTDSSATVVDSSPSYGSYGSSSSTPDSSSSWGSGQSSSSGSGWGSQSSSSGSGWGSQSSSSDPYGQSSNTAPSSNQASGSGVPANWYADPAGRYELRYWDGQQWTEHVSRNGQTFTDPPVA